MARATRLAGRPVSVALAAVILCALTAASARSGAQPRSRRGPVRVAIGELDSFDGRDSSTRQLTEALHSALEDRDDVRLTSVRRAQLVLRGSIVRMDRRRLNGGVEIRCEVSLIVADARGGSIRAMLRGRAGARSERGSARLGADALQAAVRGALRSLGPHGGALAAARGR